MFYQLLIATSIQFRSLEQDFDIQAPKQAIPSARFKDELANVTYSLFDAVGEAIDNSIQYTDDPELKDRRIQVDIDADVSIHYSLILYSSRSSEF